MKSGPSITQRTHYPCKSYTPIARHLGRQSMYDTMRNEFLWPHMANDVYQTVENCATCARYCRRAKIKGHLELFHAWGPLEFIAMDILGPLMQTKNEIVLMTVMRDRYLKMTRAVPNSKTTVTHVANVVFHHWVVPSGIRNHLLTDSSPQSVSKFFERICCFFGLKHVTTVPYRSHMN